MRARSMHIFKDAVYLFSKITPKFLGTVVQNCRPRKRSPSSAFQKWIDKINNIVSETLVPELSKLGMVLSEDCYARQQIDNYCPAIVPDFNSLIAKS